MLRYLSTKVFILGLFLFVNSCSAEGNLTTINVDENTTVRPVSGSDVENSSTKLHLRFPPKHTDYTRSYYGYDTNVIVQDMNNDGIPDVVYSGMVQAENAVGFTDDDEDGMGYCGGEICIGLPVKPILYIGQNNGTFRRKSDAFVDNRSEPDTSTGIPYAADFNGDGILDLYLANAGDWNDPENDGYYLSQPDGTWMESSETHLSEPRYFTTKLLLEI